MKAKIPLKLYIEGIEMGAFTDRQIKEEMDSIDIGSSNIEVPGSNSEAPTTVFSPRKTRSGRVR